VRPLSIGPVLHRNEQGAVLRGYRIPVELHRRAERAKLEASAKRGATLFWDEIMQAALDELPSSSAMARELAAELPPEFASHRHTRSRPTGATRVLQATIRHDQELLLRTLRLDLEELTGRVVRLEELWTWLVRRVVEANITT
jgi:hypothetical protein